MPSITLLLYAGILYMIYDMFYSKKSDSEIFQEGFAVNKNLSYQPYVYQEMVDVLLNDMHGFGHNYEEVIKPVFGKLKNNDDARELKQIFGKRPYTGLVGSFGLLNDEVPLTTWLQDELYDSEKVDLRKYLHNKGITEHFV
jgi:hypothetical protein